MPRKQDHKVNWMKDVYLKYDLSNPIKNPQGPHNAFSPNLDGHLFKYDGKHPDFIENAGLTKFKDFRKLYD